MSVRDGEDIIEENLRFHLGQGVDFFIVTDHDLQDGIREILKIYERKGVLKHHWRDSSHSKKAESMTQMTLEAYNVYEADWIINNEADEFWFPGKKSTLKEAFNALPKFHNLLVAERSNFIPLEGDEAQPFWKRMIYKETESKNPNGAPLSPRWHTEDRTISSWEGEITAFPASTRSFP
jgi:hypothetical protein